VPETRWEIDRHGPNIKYLPGPILGFLRPSHTLTELSLGEALEVEGFLLVAGRSPFSALYPRQRVGNSAFLVAALPETALVVAFQKAANSSLSA